jgi:hypothetical protein
VSSRDSAIGDMLLGAKSRLLQDPPGSGHRDAQCPSYIAKARRPPGSGLLPRRVSSHRRWLITRATVVCMGNSIADNEDQSRPRGRAFVMKPFTEAMVQESTLDP